MAQTILFAQGVGNDNNYQYATTQKGTFPWSPCQPPASDVLPANLSTVSASFIMPIFVPYGSYRYHIYVALYYWLPNGAVTAGGSTYQCLDTQSRVENINGVFSPVGSTSTYDPGDSFGWDNVTLGQVTTGQPYVLTADVAHQCRQDLTAWGLNPNTPCQLAGIEIGIEGFQFQELDINWQTLQFATSTTSAQPLTSSFDSTPSAPQPGQVVTFTGTAAGGTPNYAYTWSFGDGSTGAGQTVSHTYSTAGTYIVALTVKDSSSLQQSVISQRSVPVISAPSTLRTSFGFNPSSPGTGQQVILTASTNGGTAPYSVSWTFGDGSTGGGSLTSHAYSSAGNFIVTLTVNDSGSPQQTATSQQSVSVASPTPTVSNKFNLSVQIFDADGAAEETITLNSRNVASVPSTYSPQNAQVYTRFNFNMTNLVVRGANTLVFTHAPWDCSVNDNLENLVITQNGINIFNDPANRTLNCNTLVTYTFYTPLSASFIFTPNSPRVGQSVTFTASAVGGFAPYKYTWNFNDGTKGTGQTATHVIPAGYDYNVTLTVADSQTKTVSVTNNVSVNPPPPLTASFTWIPLSPAVGNTVTFTATISGGVTPYNMTWNFGDGTTGIGLSPAHTYTANGVYYVTMNAADNIGE